MKTTLIFICGVALGTAVGLLTAPASGKKTIQRIKKEADRFVDSALEKEKEIEENTQIEVG